MRWVREAVCSMKSRLIIRAVSPVQLNLSYLVHTALTRGGEWMVSLIYGIIRHKYRYTHMDTDIVLV